MARILFLVPFRKLYPPVAGGALRAFHLLREVSREHEVHAVILQPRSELQTPVPGCEFPSSVRIYNPADTRPDPSVFDLLPARFARALRFRWLVGSLRGPTDSLLLECHAIITSILRRERIELAILESLPMMLAAPLILRRSPATIRVLLSHNVDHVLMRGQPALASAYRRTLWYESHLARFVHAYFTCSDDDRDLLARLNGPACAGITVPNGVDAGAMPFDDRTAKAASARLIFCGTLDYPPNREGLLWFCREIWPLVRRKHPPATLAVVGRGQVTPELRALGQQPGIEFIGEVPDTIPHYHAAGIAIIPLLAGSGTRHKILHAMSLGNPVVSTRIGAEGIKATNGEHLLLADGPGDFSAAVVQLLGDGDRFRRLQRAARNLVEQQYDWRIIGQGMNRAIAQLLAGRSDSSGARLPLTGTNLAGTPNS